METSKCTYYPLTLSCVWEGALFIHDPTSSCGAACRQSLRCWGFLRGLFTAQLAAGTFRHDPAAAGCTLVKAEALATCRPAVGDSGSYAMVLKLCYECESRPLI